MNDAGYTLTEMLVALVMTGLALAGVAASTRVVARAEHRITQARHETSGLRRMDRLVAPLLLASGPFERVAATGDLRGAADHAAFATVGGETAELTIEPRADQSVLHVRTGQGEQVVAIGAGLGFRYVSALDGQATETWPPTRNDRLGALVMMRGGSPIAVFPVGRQQAAACAFDLRTHGCAAPGQLQ